MVFNFIATPCGRSGRFVSIYDDFNSAIYPHLYGTSFRTYRSYRNKYGPAMSSSTIAIKINVIVLLTAAALICFLDFSLFSISEAYSCPPSKGPMGRALNIPTLKLINHSQNSILEITGK
jgi:hypothetical protein